MVGVRQITDTTDEGPKKSQARVERWLAQARPAWREGYDFLMATKPGVQYYDALLAVWLSVGKDDRGKLRTRDEFAGFIGVSRAVTYQWQARRPEIAAWAQELVELRFGGTRLADVDERVYEKAKGRNSTPGWARLFYERGGVLRQVLGLHHMGPDDGPVQIEDVKDELERRLCSIAAGEGAAGVCAGSESAGS